MANDNFENGMILVENGKIIAIGNEVQYPSNAEVIDAKGGIMIPGFINTHTHIGMIPFRGLGEDMPDRLHRFLFPLEQNQMTEPAVFDNLNQLYQQSNQLLHQILEEYDEDMVECHYFLANNYAPSNPKETP